MTPPVDVELTRRYQKRLAEIAAAYSLHAAKTWDQLPGYDESNIGDLITGLGPVEAAARKAAADLTSGYLGWFAGRVVPVDVASLPLDLEALWRQPFMTTWAALARGEGYDAAVTAGRSRAESTAGEVITKTSRRATEAVDQQSPTITAWNRVPSGTCCNWCSDVSGQDYYTAESASLGDQHANCNCTVIPVTRTSAPGQKLNAQRDQAQSDTGYVTPSGGDATRPDAA